MNDWEKMEREAAAQAFERAAAAIRSGQINGARASWSIGKPIDVEMLLPIPLQFIVIDLVVGPSGPTALPAGEVPALPAPKEDE